ncbi:P-loop ATPase, Sll1717 family [Rhodanobacter hydrolyticus]|uniref:ATPase n=1 Tax=Rhodanobacter hydrolyticus TaxID=2250595 RepID=A0ABW8JC22_9GAMM
MSKQEILAEVDFGQRIAEEEGDNLASYFVETDNWRRVFGGDIDVIYGPKGSGKSALYSLLVARAGQLLDRQVVLVPGENPRGTPAFRDLMTDPPVSEREFVNLWKLYFLSLLVAAFDEYGIEGDEATRLRGILAKDGLVKGKRTLQALVHVVFDYVKGWARPKELEGNVKLDPHTQLPIGFGGKIVFSEPSANARAQGVEPIDALLAEANEVLRKYSNYSVWILLDRLDVAFTENSDLEKNALRALFRVCLDIFGFGNIKIKIFLRTDIWNRITNEGFREASHITRHVTIAWNRASLLNLIVKRALHNAALVKNFDVKYTDVIESAIAQDHFFYRLFPTQVDGGPNKPTTLDWMLSRTRDGSQNNAPRELIHFLNSLRSQQMRRLELGEAEPEGEALFARSVFKEALPEVSEVRLTQTLYAEYPELRGAMEKLRGGRTSQKTDTLAKVWNMSQGHAYELANNLADIGFFEKRGARDDPEYWVPFLYRDALDMVQGTAE